MEATGYLHAPVSFPRMDLRHPWNKRLIFLIVGLNAERNVALTDNRIPVVQLVALSWLTTYWSFRRKRVTFILIILLSFGPIPTQNSFWDRDCFRIILWEISPSQDICYYEITQKIAYKYETVVALELHRYEPLWQLELHKYGPFVLLQLHKYERASLFAQWNLLAC